MDLRVQSEQPGRMRVVLRGPIPETDLGALEAAVTACPAVRDVRFYPRIGSLAVTYGPTAQVRDRVLAHLRSIDAADVEAARVLAPSSLAPRSHTLVLDLAWLLGTFAAKRLFVPYPVCVLLTLWGYRRYLGPAVSSLLQGRLDVPVLDAAAIGISLLRGDFATAGETMLLLDVGETLEDYTRARSEHDLVNALLSVPESAQLVRGDQEEAVPATSLAAGDLVVVRTGMPVCVDGQIERGRALVNQAALTGEPLAVERTVGDDVFAGTSVEEGEVFVRVRSGFADTRLRSIVSLVERSEGLASTAQLRREELADRIVPWNFLLAGVVALTTRSIVKTSAALMVDYSCALKLTGSIAALAAMRQSAREGFVVKGSKHFEAMARADTIVFDKTGTLTNATPRVAAVLALDGYTEEQVLRLAACLEEHFPHPVARAVVAAAVERKLEHRERHTEVEYVVAHGIASSIEGKRCVIGSEHFVVEDEGVALDEKTRERIARELNGFSPLYLAVGGELVGVIGVTDPLKPGVRAVINELRGLGFEHVVMLTGDGERAAARAAAEAGIAEYRSAMLPEHKYAYVEDLKAQGRHVVMVGDGVNDSPALSLADVGIAMESGTAVAREVADITLASGDLALIARLRRLSLELDRRMDRQFREVMGFNSLLLVLGIGGVITPQLSSLLHNGSTVLFSAESTRSYDDAVGCASAGDGAA
jgi:heavy metal translocating P-type ATPase